MRARERAREGTTAMTMNAGGWWWMGTGCLFFVALVTISAWVLIRTAQDVLPGYKDGNVHRHRHLH
jgi:hypothetical protein